ncbi:MAG: capsular biosynthesis protein, partial [Clostridia bacterium]|nr:capsular biosynthesis protein [Clostridia bacterium]
MFDLHCHILHDIDDGARSLEESVHLCRLAVQNSIQTAVLTPHLVRPEHVDDVIELRDRRIEELRNALAKENIPLELVPGAEVFVNDDIFYAPSLDAATLGGTRYMLIEFDFNGLNINRIIKYVEEIKARGYYPIIAHPERYRFIQQ